MLTLKNLFIQLKPLHSSLLETPRSEPLVGQWKMLLRWKSDWGWHPCEENRTLLSWAYFPSCCEPQKTTSHSLLAPELGDLPVEWEVGFPMGYKEIRLFPWHPRSGSKTGHLHMIAWCAVNTITSLTLATPNQGMKCHMPELQTEHQSGFVCKEHGLFCVNPQSLPMASAASLASNGTGEKATPHCLFLMPVSGECTKRQDLIWYKTLQDLFL